MLATGGAMRRRVRLWVLERPAGDHGSGTGPVSPTQPGRPARSSARASRLRGDRRAERRAAVGRGRRDAG